MAVLGFSLIWTGDQIDKVAEDFSDHIADSLENTLEDKQRQIKWYRSMSDLSTRVHKIFNLNGLTVAELRFSTTSAECGALCVVISEEEVLFYYSTVPKGGNHQERELELVRENSGRIKDYFSEKYWSMVSLKSSKFSSNRSLISLSERLFNPSR